MQLPAPFTSVRVAIGAPLPVPRQLTGQQRDRLLEELRAHLTLLTRLASPDDADASPPESPP
jgi:hypothetical protein